MPLAAVPDPAHIRALPIATVSDPRPIAVSTTDTGTAAVIIASLAALIRAQTLIVDYDITPVRALPSITVSVHRHLTVVAQLYRTAAALPVFLTAGARARTIIPAAAPQICIVEEPIHIAVTDHAHTDIIAAFIRQAQSVDTYAAITVNIPGESFRAGAQDHKFQSSVPRWSVLRRAGTPKAKTVDGHPRPRTRPPPDAQPAACACTT